MKYIKSPLNYVGGKYKLLPQLLPLFPKEINTFIDLFSGGANVGINVQADKIICNDIQKEVIEFCNMCLHKTSEELLDTLDSIINTYKLSKINKEGFLQLRNDYNQGNNSPEMFYVLVVHSFNNQIRFNSKGEFNMPFGKNRSSFNPRLRQRFIEFVDHLKTINISFTNLDYKDFMQQNLGIGDFVYADPPYLITNASYNEQGGWTEKDEYELLHTLDYLNLHNVKFALSNVLENKGKKNDILIKWSKRYNINYLNNSYSNCNYQSKDKGQNTTIEVLITNY